MSDRSISWANYGVYWRITKARFFNFGRKAAWRNEIGVDAASGASNLPVNGTDGPYGRLNAVSPVNFTSIPGKNCHLNNLNQFRNFILWHELDFIVRLFQIKVPFLWQIIRLRQKLIKPDSHKV